MHPSVNPADSPEGLLAPPRSWRRPSLLIAASGGLDSTVLLDILGREAARRGGPRLGVACLDHGWREAEGTRDRELVSRLCARLGIPFFAAALDNCLHANGVRFRANGVRRSPEAAAREARYARLAEIARREGFAAIATGHHAGDQAETLLLAMARGARDDALAGIRYATRLAGVEVVRPFLDASPDRLLAYAEARRLPFREDASNRDPRFPRNRLRKHAVSRAIHRDVASLARLGALERALIEAIAARLEARLLRADDDRVDVRSLVALHPALRRELLARTFRRVSRGRQLSGPGLALLERLLRAPRGGRADLAGARVTVSCGWLRIESTSGADPRRAVGGRRTPPGFPEGVGVREGTPEPNLFDPAELVGPLVVRSWRPGDRIEVRLGPRSFGRKKVKDVFREGRVPVWERGRHPIVADDRGVLWVVGLRRSPRARPRHGFPVVRLDLGEPSAATTAAPALG